MLIRLKNQGKVRYRTFQQRKQAEADEDMEGLFDDLKVKMKNHYKLQRKMYKAIRKVDNALANEFNTKTLEKAVKRATKTMDKNHDKWLTRLEKANNQILTKRYLPVVRSFYEKVRDHFRSLVLALRDDSVFTERYANNEADKFTKLGERMREVKQDVNRAAHKGFEISKFKLKFPRARTYELIRARSRLYRSQNFASKYSLESSRRELHNAFLCTVL